MQKTFEIVKDLEKQTKIIGDNLISEQELVHSKNPEQVGQFQDGGQMMQFNIHA
jgi:hypothetical protein